MEIQDAFKVMLEWGGSDLHLKVGLPPAMRLKGKLERFDAPPLTADEIRRWVESIASAEVMERLDREREADFSYSLEGLSRFRCNVFHQMGRIGGVFRVIPSQVPTLESLGMPEVLKSLTHRENGIVLVTGPTGSGKSTTLAAMIDYVNAHHQKHILTIEDPIEFVHTDQRAIINQREVGADTKSFSEALRRALRQDPDVILVGEMRDSDTITIAMTAAETGHLVFSTLHTNDAKQSVDRIINTFPPEEQHQVRMKLAVTLGGVVSQRLVRKADGSGRVAVQEIMVNSPTIKKLIEDAKTGAIDKAIEESGDFYGMQSMNAHLLMLWQDGVISEEDAYGISNNPNDLKLRLQTAQFASQIAGVAPQRAGWETTEAPPEETPPKAGGETPAEPVPAAAPPKAGWETPAEPAAATLPPRKPGGLESRYG